MKVVFTERAYISVLSETAEKIQEEKEKICLPICRQIFELAEMLDYDFYVKHLSKHCRKEYKVEISSSLS